jgi:mannose-1-phosphate guanylyltransferase
MHVTPHWAGILAGGNGTRLHAFTKAITGDDRPKQFCRLLSSQTLLGATRARLSSLVEPERTLYVVTAHHAPYYRDELHDVPSYALIEQPANRGTTPAIACAVARLAAMAPDSILALFPADHHFEEPSVLRQTVATAYAAATIDAERVFLIGAEPDGPEPEYGYIRAASPLAHLRSQAVPGGPIRAVGAFVEKPSMAEAASLVRQGCVWNTFVLVGHVRAFIGLFEQVLPGYLERFAAPWPPLDEGRDVVRLYDQLTSSDFSREVLMHCAERLGVITLPAGNWTDLGLPSRVLEVRAARRRATTLTTMTPTLAAG